MGYMPTVLVGEHLVAVDINSPKFIEQVSVATTHGWLCKYSPRKRSFIRSQGWTAMLCLGAS